MVINSQKPRNKSDIPAEKLSIKLNQYIPLFKKKKKTRKQVIGVLG